MDGKKIDIKILKLIDAGHFKASPIALPGSEFENFMGRLNDYFLYQRNASSNSVIPEKGKLYAVQRTMDKCWYRARIQNIMQTTAGPQASVSLVDVGEQTLIPFSRICKIPKEFENIPFQVMECHLTTVKPLSLVTSYFDLTTNKQVSDKWTEAATKFVLDLIRGCKLQVMIQTEDDKGGYHVLLYGESPKREFCVNDELVQNGFAVLNDAEPVRDENPRKTERIKAQQEQFVRAQQEVVSAFKKSINTPKQHYTQEKQQEKQQESTSTDEETPSQHRRHLLQEDTRQPNPLDFLRQQVAEIREPKTLDLPVCYIPAGAESRSSSSLPSVQNQPAPKAQDGNFDFREKDAQGRDIFSPLSSDEDSGRVRFVSARIPATGSGVPYLGSRDQDTSRLKSILKPSRSLNQYSGSSSEQEGAVGSNRLIEHQQFVKQGDGFPEYPGIDFPRAQDALHQVTTERAQSSSMHYSAGRLPNVSSSTRNEFSQVSSNMDRPVLPQCPEKMASVSAGSEDLFQVSDQMGQALSTEHPAGRLQNRNISASVGKGYYQSPADIGYPLQPRMPVQDVSQASVPPSQTMDLSKPTSRLPSEVESTQGNTKPAPRLPSDLVSHSSPLSDPESNLEDGVLIHGEGIPRPFVSVANCPLYEYGSRLNIQTPTPLQRYVWPALLRGRDVAGIAQKNAGRKMAFLLPIIDQVLNPAVYSELPFTNGPLALILCDSWSNAKDVYNECNKILGPRRTARVHVVFGGGAEEEQVIPLINGCEVLVATVPCFLRMLKRSYTTLDRLCHIVFDNADSLVEDFTAEVKEIMRIYGRLLKSQPGRVAPRQAVIMASLWTLGVASLVRAYLGNPLIIIDDKVEATIYSGVKQAVELCSSNKRLSSLLGFLENAERTHEIVIFTNTAQEAENLGEALKTGSHFVLVAHEFINPQELAQIRRQWYSPHSEELMPILVMTDGVVMSRQLTIQNASMVIHYDLPLVKNKEKFGERFFTMSRTFTATKDHGCLSVIFITETCLRQSNIAHQLVHRTSEHTPAEDSPTDGDSIKTWKITSSSLEEMAQEARMAKERDKSSYELCDFLMAYGLCRTFSDKRKCIMRHVVLKDEDYPRLPTNGTVKVLVLHVMNATCLWVRVLEHKNPKSESPYNITTSTEFLQMAVEMGMWYANEKNRTRIDMPRISDLCALEQDGSYHRVKVCDVVRKQPQSGLPLEAQVHFVDRGTYQDVKVSSLLYLPSQFRVLPLQAVQVFVCRVRPQDKSLQWTPKANSFVKNLVEGKELEGRIVLSLGNTMWLDPLFERRVLKSINVTTNINNIRMELLKNGLATENKHHIKQLRKLCEEEIEFSVFDGKNADGGEGSCDSSTTLETVALTEDDYQDVFVSAVENPGLFFVQIAANDPSLDELERAIEEGVHCVSYEDDDEIAIGSLCLACFTKDDKWYRARVLGTRPDNEYDVFFVDYGDREWLTRNRMRPSWPEILTIPLQAVECSLVNVIPLENDWTDSDGDELWDMCSLADGDRKLLVAKVKSKVASLMSGCHRFVVELFDTSTSIDIVISEELVATGHAQTSPEGIQTLFPETVVQLGRQEYKYEYEKIPDMCRDILQSRDPSQRLSIAKSIQTIVVGSPSAKDAIRDVGGVRSLCRLLALTRAPAVQEHLLVSLDCLAFQNNNNCDEARRAGGLKTLCYLMEKSRNVSVKSHVAWTLKNLAATETNKDTILKLDGIRSLCNELDTTTDHKLQEHIAWALEVLSTDSNKNCEAVHDHGGLKALCHLVSNTTQQNVLERTTKALAALASATPSSRNLIRQHGGLEAICRRIQDNPDEDYLRVATGTLKVLVSNNQHNKDVMRDMGMIHTLQKLTTSSNISSITRRLCSDLLQRLLGWAATGFDVGLSPEKIVIQPQGPSPPVVSGILKTRTEGAMPELRNGVEEEEDMPPLEGSDDEEEELPRERQHSTQDRAKTSTKNDLLPIPLKIIPQKANNDEILDENDDQSYHPFTVWSQTKDLVRVAVRLRGVNKHNTEIQEKRLLFSTKMQGKNYSLDLDLYNSVINEESKVEVKGDEVLILLRKSEAISWPRLLNTKDKLVYLKIDLDRWEWSTSEDEDETARNTKPPQPRIPIKDKKKTRGRTLVPEMDTSESSSSDSDDEDLDFRDMLSFD